MRTDKRAYAEVFFKGEYLIMDTALSRRASFIFFNKHKFVN